MEFSKNILITGGAGFIGSHLLKQMVEKYDNYRFINIDLLTYAGNLDNIKDLKKKTNYFFEREDICNYLSVKKILIKYKIDSIIHLAAESHVDQSISNPLKFINTNIIGTVNLLNVAKEVWENDLNNKLFYHVSTDEVYGSLDEEGFFTELTRYDPNSPYSASKASSDHFVRAYGATFGLPYVISNCSNNFGPYQYPEKLIPLFIINIINKKPLPLYGNGNYTRDWLYVLDHVSAIDAIFHSDKIGETYNIGATNEWSNIELIKLLCEIMDLKLNRRKGSSMSLIKFVKDRPGHDKRYAIDSSKLLNELNWRPSFDFKKALDFTVDWYLKNNEWIVNIRTRNHNIST
jgi:dTDP-glucose 4,6-dehydratase